MHQAVSETCILVHGQAHMGQMGRCPWRCITTRKDNSTELQKIIPTVLDKCISANEQVQMDNQGHVHIWVKWVNDNDHDDAAQLQIATIP